MLVINSYINLKNTGKLGFITNQKIKEKFTSLEISRTSLVNMWADRLNVHQIRIDDIVEKEFNFVRLIKTEIPTVNVENELQSDYYKILKSQRLRNLFGIKLIFTQNILIEWEDFNKDAVGLMLLIETELKNRK